MRIKYWMQYAAALAGGAVLLLPVGVLFLPFINGMTELLKMWITTLWMYAWVMILVTGLSLYQMPVPTVVSLGSTRREAFYGSLLLRLGFLAFVSAEYILIWLLPGNPEGISGLWVLAAGAGGGMLQMLAGSIRGAIRLKHSGKLPWISSALTGLLTAVLWLILIVIKVIGERLPALCAGVFGVGLAALALCLYMDRRNIYSLSVSL